MNFQAWKLYHCPGASEYAKTVLDMKILMSGLIMEMLKILDGHKYCYEFFPMKMHCSYHAGKIDKHFRI